MTYRDFARPRTDDGKTTVTHWLDWMQDEGDILVPVAPQHEQSCDRCFGASGYQSEGHVWPTCWHCRTYGDAIDAFVPITYSVDGGLESMLHRYKDRGAEWLRRPLASLLCRFVDKHADCIDRDAQGIDLAAIVPSNNPRRSFNHLEGLLGGIRGDPVLSRFNWNINAVIRDHTTARPRRGELKPSAYRVDPDDVDGAAVLLLDDTWTSGSSAASAAEALKEAGAMHVTVLTLGRQLNPSNHFGSTDEIIADRGGQPWTCDVCVLCA